MRVPVYLVCTALAVAAKTEELSNYYGRQLEPIDLNTEQETINYLIPRLMAKYRLSRVWNEARNYELPDMESNSIDNQLTLGPEGRIKRNGFVDRPSLSIVNSLDVLRNRLLLEISRKKALEGANRNRDYLCKIGKRSSFFDAKQCDETKNTKQFLNDN